MKWVVRMRYIGGTDRLLGAPGVHFRGLDLNLLVALDALLAEASVTAAGRKLHLSQSAMSGALARLREHFRDPLLVQVGRRMQPTPCARELAATVRSILVQIDASLSGQAPFDPLTAGRR
ncbi:MAG: LysR family transcriptional regulator [Rubrivivax sp.]